MKSAGEAVLTGDWLDAVKWNQDGLVPVITQDYRSGRVLTHAWLNRDALSLAVSEQRAVYWSRSRRKLWRKGEESGHRSEERRVGKELRSRWTMYYETTMERTEQ